MRYLLFEQMAESSNPLKKSDNIYKVYNMILIDYIYKLQLSNSLSQLKSKILSPRLNL